MSPEAPESRRLFRLLNLLAGFVALIVAVSPTMVLGYLSVINKQTRLDALALASAAQVTDYVSRMQGIWLFAPSRAQSVAERVLQGGDDLITVDVLDKNGDIIILSSINDLPFPILSASAEVSDFGVHLGYIRLNISWRREAWLICIVLFCSFSLAYLVYFPLRRLPLAAINRALSDLAASEAALRKAQAIAHVGSWRYKVTSGDLQWSEETRRIFGVEPNQRDSFDALAQRLHLDDALRIRAAWRAALDGRTPCDLQYRIHVDGAMRWVHERIEISRDAKGRAVSVDGVIEDVTERFWREEQLRKAKDEAAAGNRAKTKLLANMSHELRTPLNAIIGLAEALTLEPLGPLGHPSYKMYASRILSGGERLLDLVSDLLYAADIEAGEVAVSDDVFDVETEVAATAAKHQERAEAARVVLRLRPSPAPLRLRADVKHFRRILSSLLSNAIAFSPSGAEVEISMFCNEDGGGGVSVADHGPGLTAEQIAAALKPFGRSEPEEVYRRKDGGVGLGLSIAVGLTQAHGGELTIQSREGEGGVFTVSFPPTRVVTLPPVQAV